mmetsp:Transcript_8351/g.9549  ORF Transcript_8351/g.9549 Transcript_8351/m.9549 type:complete len:641 (-) Transcript_8351:363-2285(-)
MAKPGPERSRVTRKRKAPPTFYGYDPTILSLPGDPRLTPPPPSWYGVNYHRSQPVTNAWLDWSGSNVELFDLSKNKIIHTKQDAEIRKEDRIRKRRKFRSDVTKAARITPPPHMVLHPTQPVHNTWMDWESLELLSSSDSIVNHQDQAQTGFMPEIQKKKLNKRNESMVANQAGGIMPITNGPQESRASSLLPSIVKRENDLMERKIVGSIKESKSIPATTKLLGKHGTRGPESEEQNTTSGTPFVEPFPFHLLTQKQVNGESSMLSILRRKVSTKPAGRNDKSDSSVGKTKKATEVKRIKQLQLVNRVRKSLYKASLETRAKHIGELSSFLKIGFTELKVGLTHSELNSRTLSGITDIRTKEQLQRLKDMIKSSLEGNSTFKSGDHSLCDHSGVDYFKIVNSTLENVNLGKNKNIKSRKDAQYLIELKSDPLLWIELIKEVRTQVESRRLKALTTTSASSRFETVKTALKGFQTYCQRILEEEFLVRALTETATSLESKDFHEDEDEDISSNNSIALGKEIIDHLGLSEDQLSQIGRLSSERKDENGTDCSSTYSKLLLDLKILHRIACSSVPLFQKKVAPEQSPFYAEILNSKQKEKILMKTANWEMFDSDKLDKVESMLKDVARLALREHDNGNGGI